MPSFYEEMAETVEELIVEFGTTFEVTADGVYDPDTLSTTAGTSRTVNGVVSNDILSFINRNTPGFSSRPVFSGWSEKTVLLLPPSAEPAENETIVVNNKTYSLSNIEFVKPADTILLYILDLSR